MPQVNNDVGQLLKLDIKRFDEPAIFGTKLLFDVSRVDALLGSLPLNMIECVFLLWALVAAQFLWRGKVSDEKREPRQFVV